MRGLNLTEESILRELGDPVTLTSSIGRRERPRFRLVFASFAPRLGMMPSFIRNTKPFSPRQVD